MMVQNHLAAVSEDQIRCHLPFVSTITIKQLGLFNFVLIVVFPYHCNITFRITDSFGAWLIFLNRGHVYSYLQNNGLNRTAVVKHD